MALEQLPLNEVVQPLVGKVDAELIQRVRAACQVLRAGQVEQTDERGEVVLAQTLVDVLVEPGDGVAVGEAEEGPRGRFEVRVEQGEEGGGGGVCEELGDGFTDLERGGGVLG